MTMTRVWLLTGASRGLGRAIAETVLAAGDRLLAGARDPRTLADLADRYPETLRVAPLDVTDPAAGEAAVRTALEPGGMRTHWGTTAQGATPAEVWPEYRAAMDPVQTLLDGIIGKETGDPAQVAQVILALAGHPNPPVHLLLGSDAVHYCGLVEAARSTAGERWKAVSLAVDFGTPEVLPAFPEA
jgi:NAD(P)-dependent dehydrogenase (short-subunit alcohol dehydrogenase family)